MYKKLSDTLLMIDGHEVWKAKDMVGKLIEEMVAIDKEYNIVSISNYCSGTPIFIVVNGKK
jgi:hypothetical protein